MRIDHLRNGGRIGTISKAAARRSTRVLILSVTVLTGLLLGAATAATVVDPAPKPAHGAAPWAAPEDALGLTVAAGLEPERKETLTHHVHSHLDVFVNGKRVVVPAGIGINIKDPDVKTFRDPDGSKAYGGIELVRGAVHLAAAHARQDRHPPYRVSIPRAQPARPVLHRMGRTPGPQLCRWLLPPEQHRVLRERQALPRRPRAILLTDHKEIAIVIGTPPKKIPKTADLANA